MRSLLQSLARNPLVWILTVAAGLRLAGLFWGLPAPDGWDDDGFAPRNFLTALALTYKPGAYFTYPPLHAIVLTLLTWPGIVLALVQAPSLHQADVIAEFTKPGTMTFFAVTARLVNLALSLGIIWCVGEMARLVAGRRAGLFAAGACALNFGLTYYGQVSNLDVPYLFWASLSLLYFMRAAVEQQARRLWQAVLFAAAAIATKDQAYGLFLLSVPVFLLLWWRQSGQGRAILRALLPAAGLALLLLLLVDGAITNPAGFLQRLHFLAGPASQDYAEYQNGPAGWLALLADMGGYFTKSHGIVAVTLAVMGPGLHVLRTRANALVAGLLPALAIASFTLCFNFVALRSDDRFLLPQAVLACFYIGIAAEAAAFSVRPWMKLAARGALAVTALFALHQAIAINAAMLFDPRYDAQAWMAAHVRPGDRIETYGQNCFLPRFPASARVARVGQGDLKLRNPLPRVTELRAPFGAPRGARFVVVSALWAERYLRAETPPGGGHAYSRLQRADFRNSDARRYFAGLRNGTLGYRLAHAARPEGWWPAVRIHDSLSGTIWIFERVP